jgi:hypothetical protein
MPKSAWANLANPVQGSVCCGIEGKMVFHWLGNLAVEGKMVFHWLGNLAVALHGISVDLDVTVNLAAPDNQLRPSATIVGTGSGN